MHYLCFFYTSKTEQGPTYKKYTHPKSKISEQLRAIYIIEDLWKGITCYDTLANSTASQKTNNWDAWKVFPSTPKQYFKQEGMVILFMGLFLHWFLFSDLGIVKLECLMRLFRKQRISIISLRLFSWLPIINIA